MQAFYGSHAADWFHVPAWQLNVFVEGIKELRAERQLLAIEASVVPHMKPDAAKRVIDGRRREATPPKERDRSVHPLLAAFEEAGMRVNYVPADGGTSKDKKKG